MAKQKKKKKSLWEKQIKRSKYLKSWKEKKEWGRTEKAKKTREEWEKSRPKVKVSFSRQSLSDFLNIYKQVEIEYRRERYDRERYDRKGINYKEPLSSVDWEEIRRRAKEKIKGNRLRKLKEGFLEAQKQKDQIVSSSEKPMYVSFEVSSNGEVKVEKKPLSFILPPVMEEKDIEKLYQRQEYETKNQNLKIFATQNEKFIKRIEKIRKENRLYRPLKQSEDLIEWAKELPKEKEVFATLETSKWFQSRAEWEQEKIREDIWKIVHDDDFNPPLVKYDPDYFLWVLNFFLYDISVKAPIVSLEPNSLLPFSIVFKNEKRKLEKLYNKIQGQDPFLVMEALSTRNQNCPKRMKKITKALIERYPNPELAKQDWKEWIMVKSKIKYASAIKKEIEKLIEQEKKEIDREESWRIDEMISLELDIEAEEDPIKKRKYQKQLKELEKKTKKEYYERDRKRNLRMAERLEKIYQEKSPHQLWLEGKCPPFK